MAREKGKKYDGISRPTNDTYAKNWNDIFGKKKKPVYGIKRENEEKENKEYLKSIKEKL
jgi:hypothetical protein